LVSIMMTALRKKKLISETSENWSRMSRHE
jgi:hypothetical protein